MLWFAITSEMWEEGKLALLLCFFKHAAVETPENIKMTSKCYAETLQLLPNSPLLPYLEHFIATKIRTKESGENHDDFRRCSLWLVNEVNHTLHVNWSIDKKYDYEENYFVVENIGKPYWLVSGFPSKLNISKDYKWQPSFQPSMHPDRCWDHEAHSKGKTFHWSKFILTKLPQLSTIVEY